MSEYKVVSKDGVWYVTDFHGGYAIGNDSEFVWNDRKKALKAIKECQSSVESKLILKKVA